MNLMTEAPKNPEYVDLTVDELERKLQILYDRVPGLQHDIYFQLEKELQAQADATRISRDTFFNICHIASIRPDVLFLKPEEFDNNVDEIVAIMLERRAYKLDE